MRNTDEGTPKQGVIAIKTFLSYSPALTLLLSLVSLVLDVTWLGFFHAHSVILTALNLLFVYFGLSIAFETPHKGGRLVAQMVLLLVGVAISILWIVFAVLCNSAEISALLVCRANFSSAFIGVVMWMCCFILSYGLAFTSFRRAAKYKYERYRARPVLSLVSRCILYVVSLSTLDIIRDFYAIEPVLFVPASVWATGTSVFAMSFSIGLVLQHGDADTFLFPTRHVFPTDIISGLVLLMFLFMTGLAYAAEILAQPQFLNEPAFLGSACVLIAVAGASVSMNRYRVTKLGLQDGSVSLRADDNRGSGELPVITNSLPLIAQSPE